MDKKKRKLSASDSTN
uniref:Uncharacterized protein n=1 Tax=Anguilla anguilla TaxID=7936 RepID=A0A0E9UGA2_ANGAN